MLKLRWIVPLTCLVLLGCNHTSEPSVDRNAASISLEADNNFENSALNSVFNVESRSGYNEVIERLTDRVSNADEDASARLALVYVLSKRNKYEDAAGHLDVLRTQKQKLSPSETLWFEALAARMADDSVQETKSWEAVTEAQPDKRWAWYELASRYYRNEDYDQTVQAVENALAIEPSSEKWNASFIHYLHSKAYFRIGNYSRAIETAEAGMQNPESLRSTYYRKAMAQIAAGEMTNPNDGVQKYREYSTKNGQLNETFFNANVALFFFELGDYDMAVDYARASYALSTGPYPSFALGYSLTEQGALDEALTVLQNADAKHPNNVNILGAKGWAHYRAGEYEKALSTLLAARASSPRKNTAVERDIKIVQAKLADQSLPQVPPVRWFGD